MELPGVVGVEKVDSISLDSLPIEIFLMICEHVDNNTLLRSLMFVNKRFYDIIGDTYLWKKRIANKLNNCDVAFMMTNTFDEDTFNWKQFAWRTELEDQCWSKHEKNTTSTIYSRAHFSEVDAVIMDKEGIYCMSASRDRSICMWDTTIHTIPVIHKANGHAGWIWDLEIYNENHFLSCSWDSSIKLWHMGNFSEDAEPLLTFTTDAAVLSIASKENFVAAGLYTPKIIAFDPREYENRLFQLNHHTRSIIELSLIHDYYLISLSEDRTMSVWDLRTHQTVKSMYLSVRSKGFPICSSYYDNVLFVGDSQANIYWYDCSHGLFDEIGKIKFKQEQPTNETQRRFKLNSIKCTNYGSIITGGNEGTVYILTPTNPPKVIAKIVDSRPEITSIDYQNNTLVVGYVSSDIQVWKKK